MSEGMSSWRSLASSAGTRFKGYINSDQGLKGTYTPKGFQAAPQEERQNWREWAGQKVKLRRKGNGDVGLVNTEIVSLFPGWAARRYPRDTGTEVPSPFEVEAFISGFAISHRSPGNASRYQRTFIRAAKAFASLPRLVDPTVSSNTLYSAPLTPSTEELLKQIKLPPRPTEISEDYEIEALEREYQRVMDNSDSASSSPSSSTVDLLQDGPTRSSISEASNVPIEVLRRLHANLESRLQPFWSSALSNRTIRLHLFASPHQHPRADITGQTGDSGSGQHIPLASQDVCTGADGSFKARFKVKWEDMCDHPQGLHIAFGESVEQHNLKIVAELLQTPLIPPPQDSIVQQSPVSCMIHVPITHCPIRVISDIDDTVKRSDIVSGARAVFRNVFVNELQDNVIPGMGDWYRSMFERGVRFHYVSNGPFEILPIINDFIKIAQLPPGSIRLKSYAGRSLFSGLLSAPATRKRAGLVDIMDSFPDSRFFLIGDSGEQDLELYADMARERPDNILAVFVRDVGSGEPIEDPTGRNAMGAAGTRPQSAPLVPRSDSTSSSPIDSINPANQETIFASVKRGLSDHLISRLGSSSSNVSSTPSQQKKTSLLGRLEVSDNASQYFSSAPVSAEPEPITNEKGGDSFWPPPYINQPPKATPPLTLSVKPSAASQSNSSFTSMSPTEATRKASLPDALKRRNELQLRVYRARTQMPGHIPLRVFRDPSECVEANEVLAKENH